MSSQDDDDAVLTAENVIESEIKKFLIEEYYWECHMYAVAMSIDHMSVDDREASQSREWGVNKNIISSATSSSMEICGSTCVLDAAASVT